MPKLKTEIDTPEMERRVRHAFMASDIYEARELTEADIQTDFEHGQWWVTDKKSGAQWSVVDVESVTFRGRFDDGFDFEQVTEGDDG